MELRNLRATFIAAALVGVWMTPASAAEPEVVAVWPEQPPDEPGNIGAETTEPGKPGEQPPTTRITNVTRPTLTVYRPAADRDTKTSVIICPGGGHRILAWDKEGTEVAAWLNRLGVTGIVLKYRVPARDEQQRWRAAVQDAQRAVSLVRSKAQSWELAPDRIGILGFSAGGETAALTALFDERKYSAVDDVDQVSQRPDFAVLVYPAYLIEKDVPRLQSYLRVTDRTPPIFLAHAGDDRVSCLNSVVLYTELKKANVPAELHVYVAGGHGFGLRPSEHACSTWPQRCEEWMKHMQWLQQP
jgi:acetyl esterase/lipase